MKKRDVVQKILEGRARIPAKQVGRGAAWANIALCKYWGKRNEELNLPVTSSLSVSLHGHGTETSVHLTAGGADVVTLAGQPVSLRSQFGRGVVNYLNLFRPNPGIFYRVETANTVATAAGLASSASGFAALVLALNDLYDWKLDTRSLSILARLGSGSACRSIFTGFVEWNAGASADGMDSVAEPLTVEWPDLRLGILKISTAAKAIGSRIAMKQTRRTSALYEAWPVKVAHDLAVIKDAIHAGDFDAVGRTAEGNALSMHATMISAWPPVLYWLPESVAAMHRIWQAREQGLRLYFTMDAGPNLKLLFMAEDEAAVKAVFPNVEVVAPFAPAN